MTTKKAGIWMDHANAHLIEFSNDSMDTKTVGSPLTHDSTLSKSENTVHHNEQNQQEEYYKEISKIIVNYDEILLFGPTEAKVELFNTLSNDSHYDNIKIEVKQTDKLTEKQQHAFVKEHFSTPRSN